RARGFALVKGASVVVGVALELVFIPYFQHRVGNGGIGATLATALSEVVVLVGGLLLMPRGSLAGAVFIDGGRALACVLLTVLLFRWLPALAPWVGIPLCILAFAVFSVA